MGKETLISSKNPNICHSLIYWESLEKWKLVTPRQCMEVDKKMNAIIGEGTASII